MLSTLPNDLALQIVGFQAPKAAAALGATSVALRVAAHDDETWTRFLKAVRIGGRGKRCVRV